MAKKILEAKTREFLDGVNNSGGKPIYELSPVQAREVLETVQAPEAAVKVIGGDADPAVVKIEEVALTLADGRKIPLYLFKPEGGESLPVVLYIHGAGWVMGSKNTHERLVRELSAGSGACVAFVEYSRSPEVKFPVAIDECKAALDYLSANGAKHGLDMSRLAFAGDSVGGNMTIALSSLAATSSPAVKPALQVLFYPVTDCNFDTGSYKEFESGWFLARAGMQWFWKQYLADDKDAANPLASPLRMDDAQIALMPRTLLITAECDVLRDEGEAFAARLMQNGVETHAARMLGTIHDFVMLNALSETPACRAALSLACSTLREALKS